MNYLAADDDNGNLNDGTPHMTAIFNAFNDQEIACGTPTVQDSGCAGNPTTAPVVTGSPFDKSAGLSWGAVAGASSYEVFRTEGVFGCDFGKVRLGETAGTSFNDAGLQNDRDYFYVVIPKGNADSCFGPASSCTTVRPEAGPNLDIDPASASLSILTGDGDAFVDNCEQATLDLDVNNTGLGDLSNVRITAVNAVSHPSTVISTSFPAAASPASLVQGATGTISFDFTAADLAFGDTLVLEVSVTSDEISPRIKTQTVSLDHTESDLLSVASQTWDFESDLDGWTLMEGTFDQTSAGGGAGSSAGYVASSGDLDNQCDQVRSPAFQLTATSTLSLQNNYEIENNSGQWWDRANIAFVQSGTRSSINPDGGRLYNASGPGATCATTGQDGWANVNNSWGASSWSASALDSANRAGKTVQLDVAYGTDASVNGKGFWFDQVTVTDIEFIVADDSPDVCGGGCTVDADCDNGLYCDGAEICNAGSCEAGTSPCSSGESCNENDNICEVLVCDNNGVCDDGENCGNCPNDCISGSIPGGGVCGNGLCEAGDGENASNCSADCNGTLNGRPSNRFSCGYDDSYGPDGFADPRCNEEGYSCTEVPAGGEVNYCCGDFSCEGAENSNSCAVDCGPAPVCGDAIIESPEVCDGSELGGNTCTSLGYGDGTLACGSDCQSFDIGGCAPPSCGAPNAECSSNDQCCSGKCRSKGQKRNTCS
jgi:hypothetical protein